MPITRMRGAPLSHDMPDTMPLDLSWRFLCASGVAHNAATIISACYRAHYERKRVYSALGRCVYTYPLVMTVMTDDSLS